MDPAGDPHDSLLSVCPESKRNGLDNEASRTLRRSRTRPGRPAAALRASARPKRALFALVLTCAAVALGLVPRVARAAGEAASASPIYVLSILTDDADDQAEALSQSLRAQLKAAPGWSLAIASQSFETLAIALRCPPKPDPACLQRVADQLRADHYVWGTMTKKAGQVTADVHLWSRGKPQADATVTYADDLTDPSQPALHTITATLLSKLTGSAVTGTLVVRAGDAGGLVVVDGQDRGGLHAGVARIVVDAGEHTVDVRIPGFHIPAQTASVAQNAEREVDFTLSSADTTAAPAIPPASEGGGGLRAGGIFGYSAIVVGAGLLVASGIEAANWVSDKSASDSDRQNVPRTVTDVCNDPANASAVDACDKSKNARTVSTLGWIFAAVGAAAAGTGIWLVVSDASESNARPSAVGEGRRPAAGGSRIEVVPIVGVHDRALDLRVSF